MRRALTSLLALVAASLVLGWARPANAAGRLGPNGSPLATSDYAIDLHHGPVFAGTRVTGLGGAYVAIAEDVDGDLQNPATPAVRPFFSTSYFDYWLGFGLTFPATLSKIDFFNSGNRTNLANSGDSFVFFTPAVNIQLGEFGFGATLEMQQYAVAGDDPSTSVRVTIPTTHIQLAHGLFHNQWVFGVGARLVAMSVVGETSNAGFTSTGNGLEFGGVFKPENLPLRLGLAVRTAINTVATFNEDVSLDANGDLVVETAEGSYAYLPKSVALPWDVNFGFAVQFGPRPFNPPWRSVPDLLEYALLNHRLRQIERQRALAARLEQEETEEERAHVRRVFARQQDADDRDLARESAAAYQRSGEFLRTMNRSYVQVSGSMLLTGPVDGAVGVETLVSQTVNRSGRHTVLSPRIGVEWGVMPEWLKLRGGGYLEPTRFETSDARLHATFGLDLKLIRWNVFGLWPDDYMWRLGLAADAARSYYTWGFSLGGWYPRKGGVPETSARLD